VSMAVLCVWLCRRVSRGVAGCVMCKGCWWLLLARSVCRSSLVGLWSVSVSVCVLGSEEERPSAA
jgi:hypothetical protein